MCVQNIIHQCSNLSCILLSQAEKFEEMIQLSAHFGTDVANEEKQNV